MTDKKIRILLADDQNLLLQSLKMALEALADDMVIAATASNGEEAVRAVETQPIDVALLDIRMPGVDGIAAARRIRAAHPEVSVIMLTTFEDEALVAEALAAGVHGYFLKTIDPEKLIAGIRAVHAGTLVLGMAVAPTLVQALGAATLRLPAWFYDLTPREKTLARLLMQGHSNKEIASEAGLGEQTVRNYMSALYEKLGVTDRKSAVDVLSTIDLHWLDRQ